MDDIQRGQRIVFSHGADTLKLKDFGVQACDRHWRVDQAEIDVMTGDPGRNLAG